MEAYLKRARRFLAQPDRAGRAGSCFAGTLFELVWPLTAPTCSMACSTAQPAGRQRQAHADEFRPYPMGNGLTRLGTRFLSAPKHVDELRTRSARRSMPSGRRVRPGHLHADDIDWEGEVRSSRGARRFLARRIDRHEANLRFAGPETMETKSSPASRPGRTGSSSGPTPPDRRAR